jgi:hypothetical protein
MMSGRRHSISSTLQSSDDDHRVVRFRPRRAKMKGAAKWREPTPDRGPGFSLVPDLAKFESDDREDDYRHRMIVNGLALVVLVALIVIGIWLAVNINDHGHALRAVNFITALDSDVDWVMFAAGR